MPELQMIPPHDFQDDDVRDALREPFDARLISKLPATQKRPSLDYVGHAAVTDRLNHAAPGWTMSEPQFVTVVEGDGRPHVMSVLCSMTIGSVTRWEVGAVDSASNYGQEAKEAMSDFIRRAAMRFGVALDLWAKEDLNVGGERSVGEADKATPKPSSSTTGESTALSSAQAPGDAPGASPSSVGAGVTRK